MVKKWPECTDPQKFVYEDVAIGTYLLLLWEEERQHLGLKTPQRFVDLGCGNGLLVYILTQEGHQGLGIDVTKRKIWDIYPADVSLEEKTITPSDINIFPESDWLIGNHSDELTPWIPVIAARSSYKCNFFLLPCCAFNFDGTKYRRQNSSVSQYTEYLQYIKSLCEDCGFITDIDRLKIPSTKRICLVSRGRNYPKEEFGRYCEKIQNIINNGASVPPDAAQNLKRSWIHDFKAREPVQKVRNCTQIDKTLIDSIVDKISNYLLQGCNLDSNWSIGKSAELNEVVQLIPQDQLKSLKSECGGLQTLLKNNHHIFKVQGGIVQLRFPKTVEEVNKNMKSNKNKSCSIKVQQKPCWFYNNHPQGCPLTDKNCSFLHVRK
ncbi:probable tRNA (uracil-O(2)-)-methyltransferase isoform X2 [Pectinophora gossypiella]|nr:probable tRNA (uracil-O(2)-)-methyltransferase isoform X2 [Pectinophora gossypiella]